MKKKKAILFFSFSAALIALSVFMGDQNTHFNDYDIRSSFSKLSPIQKQRTPASANQIKDKRAAPFKRKINQTLATYEQYKDFPPQLIKLKNSDLIAHKFETKKKVSLGEEDSKYSLEVIPSHYYLDKLTDNYHIKMRTLYKGQPIASQIEVRDEKNIKYPIHSQGLGVYQVRINPKDLPLGKKYFSILAKTSKAKAFASLSTQVNAHYFDHLKTVESDLDAYGDLFFTNRFNFYTAGDYLLEGTLYYEGKPFAQTSQLFKSIEGHQDLTLSFHGYLFYKEKVEGKFELRGLQVTKIEDDLKSVGDTYLSIEQMTSSYKWDQFNSKPFENEVILQKINTLKSISQN